MSKFVIGETHLPLQTYVSFAITFKLYKWQSTSFNYPTFCVQKKKKKNYPTFSIWPVKFFFVNLDKKIASRELQVAVRKESAHSLLFFNEFAHEFMVIATFFNKKNYRQFEGDCGHLMIIWE